MHAGIYPLSYTRANTSPHVRELVQTQRHAGEVEHGVSPSPSLPDFLVSPTEENRAPPLNFAFGHMAGSGQQSQADAMDGRLRGEASTCPLVLMPTTWKEHAWAGLLVPAGGDRHVAPSPVQISQAYAVPMHGHQQLVSSARNQISPANTSRETPTHGDMYTDTHRPRAHTWACLCTCPVSEPSLLTEGLVGDNSGN